MQTLNGATSSLCSELMREPWFVSCGNDQLSTIYLMVTNKVPGHVKKMRQHDGFTVYVTISGSAIARPAT